MSAIQKGIACRICKHNEDGTCVQGGKLPVNKADECWFFQHRKAHSGLATHSESNGDYN